MSTGYAILKSMLTVDIFSVAGDIMQANAEAIADYNRKQLLKGTNRFGQQLSPKYSEDPWFKTIEAARNYADWKKRLFPESIYDVPNLFITGVYHRSISMQRIGDSIQFSASASFFASIEAKYNNSALGLTEESKHSAYVEIVKPPLLTQVARITGFKVGT